MIKVIETTNLPIVLKALKEKKYFYDDSVLEPIHENLNSLRTDVDNNTKALNSLTNNSSIEITPLKNIDEYIGYTFSLYSNFESDGSTEKKQIATGTLNYDTISDKDVTDIIDDIVNKIDSSV